MPAALAARMPAGASSKTMQSSGLISQKPRAVQIRLGIWLAVSDVVGGDHLLRNGQTGGPQSCGRQSAATRGHDGVAFRRKRRQHLSRARQRLQAIDVIDLALFDLGSFELLHPVAERPCGSVSMVRPSVGQLHHALGIEPLLLRPGLPDAARAGGRVNQYSVQIEKNCLPNE